MARSLMEAFGHPAGLEAIGIAHEMLLNRIMR
jgi:hypothetical protein